MRDFIGTVFSGYTPIPDCTIRVIDIYETLSKVTNMPCRYQLMDIDYGLDQTMRIIQVEDHTTHGTSYLKVPVIEETSSCMGAIAWTFGLDEQTYNPTIQT